ncbi:MAG: Fe-S cluster assembly ATPase SufC [Mycoplasmataceae bacterium]|jgi:Fe-S cluster assembly ATP-binding protein|nr:Fe-S cluster assembly ATPase SufC [Mycoplasmataceae bacterium]
MHNLILQKLRIAIQDKLILKDFSLNVKQNDVVALMGPNGAGKSTLFKAIMHHFNVRQLKGRVSYDGHNLNDKSTDEIAKLGIFYATQNPTELDGVQMLEFLKLISNQSHAEHTPFYQLFTSINQTLKTLDLPSEILSRNVNVGFSGGQKKKSEILQAQLFDPSLILLDEIDSGLDIDATKIIANFINQRRKKSITLVISHNVEFLELLKPNKVIILANGEIAKTGNQSLIKKIESLGFKPFIKNVQADEDFTKEDPFLTCNRR